MSDDTFTGADLAAAFSATSEPAQTETNQEPTLETTPSTDGVVANTAVSGETVVPDANTAVANTAVANAAVVAANTDPNAATVKEPPKERWDDILENARKKAREEVETQFAWAKDMDPQEVEATRQWIALGNQNPLAALDQLIRGLANDPNNVPTLRQYFGQLLGVDAASGQASSQQDADSMPQPDIPTDASNGKPVVYSAEQLQKLLDWQARQLKSEFQKELQPYAQDREHALRAAEAQRIEHMSAQYGAAAINAIKDKPGFAENKDEIARVYKDMPRDGRSEGELLRDAYLQVVSSKLEVTARQRAVADITRKAEATTINPAAPSTPASYDYSEMSFEELLKQEFQSQNK